MTGSLVTEASPPYEEAATSISQAQGNLHLSCVCVLCPHFSIHGVVIFYHIHFKISGRGWLCMSEGYPYTQISYLCKATNWRYSPPGTRGDGQSVSARVRNHRCCICNRADGTSHAHHRRSWKGESRGIFCQGKHPLRKLEGQETGTEFMLTREMNRKQRPLALGRCLLQNSSL